MTRINVVPVETLHNKHLVAEYRELPRIFTSVKKDLLKGKSHVIPDRYVLGKGHMKFFYNKLSYLSKRQESLINEMKRRGYNPNFTDVSSLLCGIPEEYMGDYYPTEEAIMLNKERIDLRLKGMENGK